MRVAAKLVKLANGRAYDSATHRLRRWFLRRRAAVPLTPEAIASTIDPAGLEEIRARYGLENPGEDPPKYLDAPFWLEVNLQRVRALDLDVGRRRDVLDLGSGTGYFLYLCKMLGHDAIGFDLDATPMFNEMIALLGVKRRAGRVEPFVSLPDFGKRFDIITAHMICFNGHKSEHVWGVPEWDFFLDDLARHLQPRGRVWLELNREFDGTCYTPALKAFFEKRGAEVASNRVVFNRAPRALV